MRGKLGRLQVKSGRSWLAYNPYKCKNLRSILITVLHISDHALVTMGQFFGGVPAYDFATCMSLRKVDSK